MRITDVSPRDGLQNEPGVIATSDKVRLIELVAASGVDEVEVTSFVSQRWVPQLGDADVVCDALARSPVLAGATCELSALVPNERGMQSLLEANQRSGRALIGKASVFTAASESFARKNTNASIAETIDRFAPVVRLARTNALRVRGYVSCVIACPFEGPIAPARVVEVCQRLVDLGVDELDLGDTIGAGTPQSVRALLEAYGTTLGPPGQRIACTLHLHDTFGHASACVREALSMGVRSFDGAVAGLGGCPYASTPRRRAPGNINTQVLLDVARAAGLNTRVDPARLADAAAFARDVVAQVRASGSAPSSS